LIEIPSQEAVADALSRHWDIAPEAVSPWKSPRIFRIEGHGIARIGFPRTGLTSVQLVELVDRLHAAGCPVPAIIPTSNGDLSITLGQKTLSVEQELPGDGCSSADLDILFDVGRTLGKLYSVMYEFEHMPGQILPLDDWIDLTLRKAETWAAERHHDEYVRAFRSQVRNNHRNFRVRFGLVHGDVRAPNVLRHGQSLGLIDFNCKYDPQLADIGKIRNKWLMGSDKRHGRPLTPLEIADVLKGYHQTRPLTKNEVDSFPVVWAVNQAWRLAQDLRILEKHDVGPVTNWPISEQMRDLPQAIKMGEEILRAASIDPIEL